MQKNLECPKNIVTDIQKFGAVSFTAFLLLPFDLECVRNAQSLKIKVGHVDTHRQYKVRPSQVARFNESTR